MCIRDSSSLGVYDLQLQYNSLTQKIVLDTDAESPYLLLSGTTSLFTSPRFSEYFGTVTSVSGKTLLEFGFSRPPVVVAGKLTPVLLRVPYFPNAARIYIFQGSTPLLTIDVSPSLLCWENGLCEIALGENSEYCPSDCQGGVLPPPPQEVQTPPPSGSVTPGEVPPEGESGDPFSGSPRSSLLSLIFFALGLTSFSVWMYLRWRNSR